jgi:hypothetical protein
MSMFLISAIEFLVRRREANHTMNLHLSILMIVCGVFTVCAAGFGWGWYMNNSKTRLFIDAFGREGARIVLGLLGSVLILIGCLFAFGAVHFSR